ncbi:MAG: hypothetical protein JWM57_1558, partial [Phycisphaerales bacterium]|nr:hypothetical protein [Phycisphaerales bacterium]
AMPNIASRSDPISGDSTTATRFMAPFYPVAISNLIDGIYTTTFYPAGVSFVSGTGGKMASWRLSAFADEGGLTAADQIRATRQAGLHWLDLRNVEGVNVSVLPPDHAARVKQQFDAAGVGVNMLASPIGKTDIADDFPAELQRLDHLATIAPVLSCHALRIFSFYNAKAALSEDAFEAEALHRLGELNARAARHGLVLYLENEVGVYGGTVKAIEKIAKTLRGPNLKLIFDFGNFHVNGVDAMEAWRALAGVTDALHLKDNRLDGKQVNHVPVGQGGGRVREILADAVRRGWSGPAIVEPHLITSEAWVEPSDAGRPPKQYRELAGADSFAIACAAAKELLVEAGASTD